MAPATPFPQSILAECPACERTGCRCRCCGRDCGACDCDIDTDWRDGEPWCETHGRGV